MLHLFFFQVQSQIPELSVEGGDYPIESNHAANPCITSAEYEFLEQRCAENLKLLGLPHVEQRSTNTTTLGWPLRSAAGVTDCGMYTISAYVDQNPTSGTVADWNCGSNTYDGHRGTDIAITPYPYYKMDHNEVEVVAATAGTILYKSDGHFDKYCATNTDTANYIVIRHADGSQANYFHLKKNSLTAKTVGQTVVAGEYLGVVGSSGNSSGPHLHFEVWNGSTVATLNDPFAGNCNTLNGTSWWATQKPYTDPAAIKVSVNTTDAVIPACPATETPNESNSFTVPFQGAGLPVGYAKFYLFMRNETSGLTASLSILNPDNTVFNSWTYTSTATYKAGTRSFSKLLPTAPGTYTFKAVYNGTECSTAFNILSATDISIIPYSSSAIYLYPNPANGTVTIRIPDNLIGSTATVIDIMGLVVLKSEITTSKSEISTTGLSSGVYFVTVGNSTQKLVIAK
ncbi:MAG: peptidoglycan DD-metalloendopeptidase family protein [Chitinophagales bacterium]|nr:peptidoglycan DD-metalloendopeptidase family protein [Chitinophagales bacterium]